MTNAITQAQPPLAFIAPEFNPIVYQVLKTALPHWMRWREKLVEVEASNVETLVDLYHQFQTGKIRFMLAFRHPSTNDPFAMLYLLSRCVPQSARQKGMRLNASTHAHFIYDRGIPLWAGDMVGWLYAKLGCTPIRRGKLDTAGLRSIRYLFTDGQFPLAAAPEGATNGHNEVISPIEPGIAQFGFWCLEDLQKAGRTEQVMIVPIGIQYHYTEAPWTEIDQLLSQLEADAGLPPFTADTASPSTELPLSDRQQTLLYQRLFRLAEHLLPLMEQFYRKFYHQEVDTSKISNAQGADTSTEVKNSNSANTQLKARLNNLLNVILHVAEEFFAIQPKGDLSDRCRRLEQAAWDWIYREDLKDLENLSPVERGLADRIAEEASLRLWHMRIVETFVSVTGHYVIEKPTPERFAETVLLLWDMITRIKGQCPFPRPRLAAQRVQLTVGTPLSVSDRQVDYQTNRRQAIATLTQDLQTALEQMII